MGFIENHCWPNGADSLRNIYRHMNSSKIKIARGKFGYNVLPN